MVVPWSRRPVAEVHLDRVTVRPEQQLIAHERPIRIDEGWRAKTNAWDRVTTIASPLARLCVHSAQQIIAASTGAARHQS